MIDLERLARDLRAMPAAGDATPFSLPDGVTREGDERTVLRFDPPVDALALCRAFGWARPFAYSGDVHQRSWRIGLYERDLVDPSNTRTALLPPRLGDWIARVELTERPEGELPGVVTGASPAYDLTRYPAEVVRLELVDDEV